MKTSSISAKAPTTRNIGVQANMIRTNENRRRHTLGMFDLFFFVFDSFFSISCVCICRCRGVLFLILRYFFYYCLDVSLKKRNFYFVGGCIVCECVVIRIRICEYIKGMRKKNAQKKQEIVSIHIHI